MDVFSAQEEARQRAGGLFSLAIFLMAGVIGSVHVLVALCSGVPLSDGALHQRLIVWTLPISLATLLLGIVVRLYALSRGGASVARELGGRRIHPGTDQAGERLLLRLVEETSLACGLPVPELWLLDDEDGINAFAVGSDAATAVVGVTRGALERLSPEELQAVLSHEFSHIVSGDMRMKFETLAWVQGILFLSWAGRLMLASDSPVGAGFWGGRLGRKKGQVRRRDGSGGAREQDGESQSRSILGVLMMVAGVLASIFGRFFQGAIGRDREFRADAASAQAMGSTSPVLVALRKIGGIPKRSFLDNPAAPESGHLFFSEAWQGLASTFFPTHPTLEDRIRRLHPEWGGDFIASLARKVEGDPESGEGVGPSGEPASAAAKAAAAIGARKREKAKAKELAETMSAKVYPAANLEFLGWSMLPAQFATASAARRALRDDWVRETKTQEGAKALLLEMMRSGANPTSRLSGATPTQMLSLLDLSMPLLRRMALDEYYFLIKRCRHELTRMEEIDTVRFLLLHVARRRLALGLGLRQVDSVVFEELPSVWGECHVLVTIMLRFGAPTASARSSARLAAWNAIGYETPPPTLDGVTVVDMVDALDICSQCSPLLKKRILTACGLAASYQGNIPEREMAILRMFADAMGAPVPLLSTRKMEPAQVAPAQ